jgi:hypothetical protein
MHTVPVIKSYSYVLKHILDNEINIKCLNVTKFNENISFYLSSQKFAYFTLDFDPDLK